MTMPAIISGTGISCEMVIAACSSIQQAIVITILLFILPKMVTGSSHLLRPDLWMTAGSIISSSRAFTVVIQQLLKRPARQHQAKQSELGYQYPQFAIEIPQ
jgi:hypothetical protein